MAAPEEQTQIQASPEPLFSWKKYFIPLILLTSFLALFVGFYLPQIRKEVRKQELASLTPEEQAREFGYEILERDSEDQTGRTVIYRERFLFDNTSGHFHDFPYVVVKAVSIESTEEPFELLLNASLFDAEEEKKFLITDSTTIFVENLSAQENNLIPLGRVGFIGTETFKSAILQGDILALVLPEGTDIEASGTIGLIGLSLRRFRGVETLEEEVGKKLNTPRR